MKCYHYDFAKKLNLVEVGNPGRVSGLADACVRPCFIFVHTSERDAATWKADDGSFPDSVRILFVSEDPLRIPASLEKVAGARVHALRWSLPTLRNPSSQAPWRVTLLGKFTDAVTAMPDWSKEPPWEMLDLAAAPDGLVAAYVLLRCGKPLPDELSRDAVADIERLRAAVVVSGDTSRSAGELLGSADALRQFLEGHREDADL